MDFLLEFTSAAIVPGEKRRRGMRFLYLFPYSFTILNCHFASVL